MVLYFFFRRSKQIHSSSPKLAFFRISHGARASKRGGPNAVTFLCDCPGNRGNCKKALRISRKNDEYATWVTFSRTHTRCKIRKIANSLKPLRIHPRNFTLLKKKIVNFAKLLRIPPFLLFFLLVSMRFRGVGSCGVALLRVRPAPTGDARRRRGRRCLPIEALTAPGKAISFATTREGHGPRCVLKEPPVPQPPPRGPTRRRSRFSSNTPPVATKRALPAPWTSRATQGSRLPAAPF